MLKSVMSAMWRAEQKTTEGAWRQISIWSIPLLSQCVSKHVFSSSNPHICCPWNYALFWSQHVQMKVFILMEAPIWSHAILSSVVFKNQSIPIFWVVFRFDLQNQGHNLFPTLQNPAKACQGQILGERKAWDCHCLSQCSCDFCSSGCVFGNHPRACWPTHSSKCICITSS